MKRLLRIIVLGVGAAVFVFSPLMIFAADGDFQGGGGDFRAGDRSLPNPLGVSSIAELLEKIIKWLVVTIAPLIFTGMVLIGAYQILFAAGDPAKAQTGKKTILYAVIGYAIILIGWGIASIIQDLLK